MDTQTSRRRSTRKRDPVDFFESPIDTPIQPKSAGKSLYSENAENVKKTPKSSRKAAEDSPDYSPKKLRRNRTPSSKALEAVVQENSPTVKKLDAGKKRRSVKSRKASSSPELIEDSDDSFGSSAVAKPTTLFDDDADVEGQRMFAFRTPSKRGSMAVLAKLTPKTPRNYDSNKRTPKSPKTPKTPRSDSNRRTPKSSKSHHLTEIQNTPTSRPSALQIAKTPRHVRAATKKKLAKVEDSDSDEDFSASESDFNPDESTSDESSATDEEEIESPPKKASVATRILKTPSVASTSGTRKSNRNKTDDQFVFQSDDYFSKAATKNKTSSHTLDRLKNPRLPVDQLNKLMSNMKLSGEHEKSIKELNEEHKTHFDKWLTLFDEGYTILLHGFGSKRNLLLAFHHEKLSDQHVVHINGFFPNLTVKDILDSVWVDILEMTAVHGTPHETVNMIEKEMGEIPALHLFLIIHNIDGVMLRNTKAQSVLSRLASIKNIHVVASIDHINTPLIWNNTMLSNFNFIWFDVTSFLPYIDETAFENSLLVQGSGALELSSMKSVFQSLTTNARGIYIIVVNYQLKNSGSPNYQGISFKELYTKCREAFLVSSDVALRAQLTEFLDHKLAKMKRTVDGSESVTIPIKNAYLEQFLCDQN